MNRPALQGFSVKSGREKRQTRKVDAARVFGPSVRKAKCIFAMDTGFLIFIKLRSALSAWLTACTAFTMPRRT